MMMRSGTYTNFTYSAEQLGDLHRAPKAVVRATPRSERAAARKTGKAVAHGVAYTVVMLMLSCGDQTMSP